MAVIVLSRSRVSFRLAVRLLRRALPPSAECMSQRWVVGSGALESMHDVKHLAVRLNPRDRWHIDALLCIADATPAMSR